MKSIFPCFVDASSFFFSLKKMQKSFEEITVKNDYSYVETFVLPPPQTTWNEGLIWINPATPSRN